MSLLVAIQAGGRSRRMGTDKSWLEIEGRPMIELVLAVAQPLAARLAIIISKGTLQPERHSALAKKWHAELLIDSYDYCGPLGGIATALQHCEENESALMLACDLPYLSTEFLRVLHARHAAQPSSYLTVPEDHTLRKQMLCGFYGAACLPCVQQLIAENKLRVDNLCHLVPVRTLPWPDYAHLPNANRLLLNCNTPTDLLLA